MRVSNGNSRYIKTFESFLTEFSSTSFNSSTHLFRMVVASMLSNIVIGSVEAVMSVDKIFYTFLFFLYVIFFLAWSDSYDSMYDYIVQF